MINNNFNSDNLDDLLEQAFTQLEAGVSLAEVLAQLGPAAEELRPLLDMATELSDLTAELPLPPPDASLARLLAHGEALALAAPPAAKFSGTFFLTLAVVGVAIALLLVGGNIGLNPVNGSEPSHTSTPIAMPTNTTISPTTTPTNTPMPPTATNTPMPPTSTVTNTPIPPTSTVTNTPMPPTATNTSMPPTATNTLLPPTNTSMPPTATSTNILIATPDIYAAATIVVKLDDHPQRDKHDESSDEGNNQCNGDKCPVTDPPDAGDTPGDGGGDTPGDGGDDNPGDDGGGDTPGDGGGGDDNPDDGGGDDGDGDDTPDNDGGGDDTPDEDDHDNGHGNDDDHCDDSNPGQGHHCSGD